MKQMTKKIPFARGGENLTSRLMVLGVVLVLGVSAGCASGWKVQGGPKTCVEMCKGWELEFAGMVGVGNQDRTGEGASACVCQVPRTAANAEVQGSAAATASLAGPITAAQAAAAAAMAQHSAMQQQYPTPHR